MSALLPPDTTRTAGWWVQCGVSDPILATWDAYDQRWLVPGTVHGSMHRYRIVCRHSAPGPTSLDALHTLLAKMTRQADEYENSMAKGTLIHGHAKMLRDGLRAALGVNNADL